MTDPNDTPVLDLDAILARAEATPEGPWVQTACGGTAPIRNRLTTEVRDLRPPLRAAGVDAEHPALPSLLASSHRSRFPR